MCLGVPGEVKTVQEARAMVDFWGVEKEVRLDTVDAPVEPGDYILNHVGFAIRRIPDDEIEETMTLYESFMGADPDDLLREDVMDEIESGGSVPAGAGGEVAGEDSPQPADANDAEDLLDELGIDV
jgi:hydrogenase expression/formation protein HypC